MFEVKIDVAGIYLDSAATIWAEATSARDEENEVAALEVSRPIIQKVLNSSKGSFLLIALRDEMVVGFAAVAPAVGDEFAVRVHYLGVKPSNWGQGVAVAILQTLPLLLKARGVKRAFLKVYGDNMRAIKTYERVGWLLVGSPTAHSRTGKLEHQYYLAIT